MIPTTCVASIAIGGEEVSSERVDISKRRR